MTTITPIVALDVRPAAELVQLARATRPDVARESLKVLARRREPAAAALAAELVLQHADVNVRATAAVMLGREVGAEAQHVLINALGDGNPTVLRRVAQSLGRTGDLGALRALQAVAVPDDTPAGRAVATARTLLSYRHGVNDHLVEPERTGLAVFRVTRGSDITWGGKLRRNRESVVADAARELPGVEIQPKGIVPFVCSEQPGAFVANGSAIFDDGDALLARPALAGVLLRERVCSERYSLDAYVFVDDRDDTGGKAAHVWVMRPDGIVLHHGRASVSDGGVEFTITDSNAPYSRPVRVEGSLDAKRGTLAVTTAVVGKPRTDSARAVVPAARPR